MAGELLPLINSTALVAGDVWVHAAHDLAFYSHGISEMVVMAAA